MTPSSRPTRARYKQSQPNRRRRLSVERLEDRLAPALYTVNTLADESNGLGVGGVSLREALAAASAAADPDAIDFAVAGTIDLASALPNVSGSLSILGQGASNFTVRRDAVATFRIFNVTAGSDVEIAGLTIQNGNHSSGSGGGISSVDAKLAVRNCVLEGNHAFGNGGGIFFLGQGANTLTIEGTIIQDNEAESNGSGAWVAGTLAGAGAITVNVLDSAFDSNQFGAGTPVGGLAVGGGDDSTVNIINTTFTDNLGGFGGPGGVNVVVGANSTVLVDGSDFIRHRGIHGGAMNVSAGSTSTVTISDTLFQDNIQQGAGNGGGLSVNLFPTGTSLTVTRSVFSGNSTVSSGGGIAVNTAAHVAIIDSTFSDNTASANGGGVYVGASAALEISGSTFHGNSTGNDGGGLYAPNSAALPSTIANSTFSANSAINNAGGLLAFRNTITHTTVTDNRADSDGDAKGNGGGLQSNSTTLLHHTLVAGNFVGAGTARGDVFGSLDNTGSYNLIGDDTGMSTGLNRLTDGVNGNHVGAPATPIDAKLGPLALNGGPTLTHALLPGSPALDAGNNAIVTALTDQRGAARIADSGDAGTTATVDIGAYEAANQPPQAVSDTLTVDEDALAPIHVLANDSDPDGDALTIIALTNPTHGTAVIVGQGIITYQGNLNYFGPDSFTYSISDGNGHTATTVVDVVVTPVNDAPVAVDDDASTTEDHGVIVPVLINDTDDGPSGSLTVSIASVMGASNGSLLVIDGDGDGSPDGILYTPNANFNGADSFTYRASDGSLLSNVATVTVTVQAVNDSPFANADQYTVVAGGALVVPAPGVLENDTGDQLSARFFSPPSHGVLSLMRSDGSFAYTPSPGYVGSDSFEYEVSDVFGDLARALVSIDVTPPPPPPPAEEYDFGDAPDDPANPNDYPTLLVSGGAFHTELLSPNPPFFLFLGSIIDVEADGQPSVNADGDDNASFDDEDGVALGFGDPMAPMVTPFVPGFTTPALIKVVGTGYVNAWFDWNGDHDWDDEGEAVLRNLFVSSSTVKVDILVPKTAEPGSTYARFRLNSTGNLSVKGPADDGEVEDYRIQIEQSALRIHQGDGTLTVLARKLPGLSIADDGHGTITIVSEQFAESYRGIERMVLDVASDIPLFYSLAPSLSGGARLDYIFVDDSGLPQYEHSDAAASYGLSRHRLIGPILGASWDNESVPRFSFDAGGDDRSAFDDEDGLTFNSIIAVSGSTQIHATIRASRPGFSPGSEVGRLDAWIDWNHTQRFEHPFEHVFGGISPPIVAGSVDVTFVGPETNSEFFVGRFLISREGAPGPHQDSTFGETEDYRIADVPELRVVQDGSVLRVRASDVGRLLITDAGDGNVHLDAPDLPGSAAGWDFSGVTLIHLDVGANDHVQFQYTGPPDAQRVAIQPIGLELADHGDAPTVFPRTGEPTAYGDAAHLFRGPQLGAARDSEFAAQPDGNASGDDDNGLDDEDGFDSENGPLILLWASSAFDIPGLGRVHVVGAGDEGAVLDAWVDFNRDGVYGTEERLGGGVPIRVFNGENKLGDRYGIPMTTPAGTRPGETYARFRLSTAGGLGPTGLAPDGEVEDYLVTIRPWEDFGDAPESYGTLLADDGPRHTNGFPQMGVHHGVNVDLESDGQPTDQADGDDVNIPANGKHDDENGVTIPILFSSSPYNSTAELEVRVNGGDEGTDGFLDAWIDFNHNGRFDHPSEHLGGGLSIPVNGGGSFPILNVVSFTVPGWAVPGATYGRFRISKTGVLLPTGPARTGEVEDYQVTILPRAHALFSGDSGLLQVLGNAAADNLELVVNALGQVQLYSIQEHGQRVAATIFDARTRRVLDPFGRGWPTAANIRQIQVQLGDGDDVFYADGALLRRLIIDSGAGADTVILRGTAAVEVIDVANAEVVDAQTAGGNDRVNVSYNQHLMADINWLIHSGAGNDRVTAVIIPPPEPIIPIPEPIIPPPDPDIPPVRLGPQEPFAVHISVVGGGGNDALTVNATARPEAELSTLFTGLGVEIDGGPGKDIIAANVFVHPALVKGFNPQPEPPIPPTPPDWFVSVVVKGGAAADRITARMGMLPGSFSPSLTAHMAIDGGTGDDRISAVSDVSTSTNNSSMPFASSVITEMSIAGGTGNDRISALSNLTARMGVEPTPWLPHLASEINVFGGAGKDTVVAAATIQDNRDGMIDEAMPAVVEINADGGAGQDALTASATVPASVRGEIGINLDGAAGNDRMSAHANIGQSQQKVFPVVVEFNLDGGAGNDTLLARGSFPTGTPAGGGPFGGGPFGGPSALVGLTMDGGTGNDVIDAVFRGGATGDFNELEASLSGGPGDDVFRLLWTDQSWLALASVDGGLGRDRGTFAPGVEHENVEKVR